MTSEKMARSRFVTFASVAAMALTIAPAGISGPVQARASQVQQTLPASLPFVDSSFENVWQRNDQLVASGAVARSWTWGPAPGAAGLEAYADAPDGSGTRLVQYFDKSRMEINDAKASPSSQWFVTNGLLTVELISGRMQVGNSKFDTRKPANIPIASDANDTNAPTYASFGTVANTSAGEKRQPDNTGGHASQRINKEGAVSNDPTKAGLATTQVVYYDKTTGHNVPRVFMDFLNSSAAIRTGRTTGSGPLLTPWVFAMGLPISDAYWASVKIQGKQQDVLIQAFERRVLTYAPDLPAGWQVQMGNIGQHYYQWRYSGGGGPERQPQVAPGLPRVLTIPVLGVRTNIEAVSVDKNNNMDIPSNPSNVAWFKPGTVPGNVGNAAIDGHLDWYGINQAVFYFLNTLKSGDRIYVRDDKGRDRAFIVTSTLSCPYLGCPLNDIFGPATGAHLNLITCQGVFNRASQQYDKRLVVFSQAAP